MATRTKKHPVSPPPAKTEYLGFKTEFVGAKREAGVQETLKLEDGLGRASYRLDVRTCGLAGDPPSIELEFEVVYE